HVLLANPDPPTRREGHPSHAAGHLKEMPTASALQVLAPVGLGFCIHLDLVESGLGPTHGTFPLHPAWHHPTEREGRTLCDWVPYTQGTVRASPEGVSVTLGRKADQRATPQARATPSRQASQRPTAFSSIWKAPASRPAGLWPSTI